VILDRRLELLLLLLAALRLLLLARGVLDLRRLACGLLLLRRQLPVGDCLLPPSPLPLLLLLHAVERHQTLLEVSAVRPRPEPKHKSPSAHSQ